MNNLPNLQEGAVLLLNKPYTWTSFQAVNKVKSIAKYRLGIKKLKVGHAGTLDPLATGLLIVCTGKFTKKIEEFQSREKEYTGTFTLGATTPCFDMEKPVDQTFETSHITNELILSTAQQFIGVQAQVPPIFSAVKVDGKRAFDYARNNHEVELKAKTIEIKEFEITRIEMPQIDFRIVCSKGTYIRSIARDFGIAIKSGAYLSALCRTKIGEFSLQNALNFDELEPYMLSHFQKYDEE